MTSAAQLCRYFPRKTYLGPLATVTNLELRTFQTHIRLNSRTTVQRLQWRLLSCQQTARQDGIQHWSTTH